MGNKNVRNMLLLKDGVRHGTNWTCAPGEPTKMTKIKGKN
uniref:Uncharacterized protein n=1 Tax=Anguilla anguilla TaxID=7936 RepID=A0A0E9PWN3_ANGAN